MGDAGINYWLNNADRQLKNDLTDLDITLFCVHRNHEARPWEAADYEEIMWNGGLVHREEQYPNILFAKDGEIYDFHGKKVMAIGGAYSVDKFQNGMQDIIMWKVKRMASGLCLKTMMRYVRKSREVFRK